jgi:UDP-glucose 4-epimerase
MLIIITGGLGFLGSQLAKRLSSEGYEIIIIDKKRFKKEELFNKLENIKIYGGVDLTSSKLVNRIKINKPNIILHCAGQPSAARSFEVPSQDLNINISGTLNIINWAKKNYTQKIIYASTFNVYQENVDYPHLKESFLCEPKSLYAVSKLSAENYIKVYCNFLNIKWNIVRMFNIYGPGQDPNNKYLGMISIFLNMAKKNGKIFIKGSLDRFRDFVFIDDVLYAWGLIIKDKKYFNNVYNIGSGKKTVIKDLIKVISSVLDKRIIVKVEKGTPGDFLGCYANIEKIKNHLGYSPKYNLVQGLKIFNKWLNENEQY